MMTPEQSARWGLMMAAAQGGDRRAYHQLLLDITPLVRAVLVRRVGAQPWVDDVVQEVLLGVHHGRQSYNPEQPFHHWLLAITRYKAMDALRQLYRKNATEVVDSDFLVTLPAEQTNPFITQHDDRRTLAKLLARLKPRERRVLVMTKMQQHSVADVAAHEGMSEAAVKVTVHRAIKLLRKTKHEPEA